MRSVYDKLRNPSHTGERRCWPCTAVNAGILLVACAGIARRRSRSLAAALGAGGVAAIALRGYLVPYTPRFAPALATRLPVDRFLPGEGFHANGEREAPDAPGSLGGEADGETGEQVLAALVDSGVVTADEEAVYLSEDFREPWRSEMGHLRERNDEGLAKALRSVAPGGTVVEVVESGGDSWFVVSDGSGDPAHESWLTRPVAVAETAAVWVLADRTDLTETQQLQAAGPLRSLLESCPVCDGRVEETTTVECCGGPGGASADAPDDVLACTACGERLYTFR